MNEEINKYIEIHDEFLSLLFQYHNLHRQFSVKPNAANTRNIKISLKELRKIIYDMYSITSICKKEHSEEKKTALRIKREKNNG